MHARLTGLALVGTVAVLGASPAWAGGTTLTGTVGPEDTITLTKLGHKVASLQAGRYTIVIADKASDHNFHLSGPGIDKSTSISGTGRSTWHVTLRKGTYRFVCDPHASFMKGAFVVK